jgi:hypothetical protein
MKFWTIWQARAPFGQGSFRCWPYSEVNDKRTRCMSGQRMPNQLHEEETHAVF